MFKSCFEALILYKNNIQCSSQMDTKQMGVLIALILYKNNIQSFFADAVKASDSCVNPL